MIPIAEHNIVRLSTPVPARPRTPFSQSLTSGPADEVEQPDTLRAGLHRLHGALQRVFVSARLSANHQARRVRRARGGEARRQANRSTPSAAPSSTRTAKSWRTTSRSKPWWPTPPTSPTRPRSCRCWPRALEMPAAELAEKLASDRRYIVLKREVPKAIATALQAETARAEFARHLFRARFGAHLSERLDALPRHRLHRFRASRHPGRGSVRWSNICTARTAIATSSTTAPGRNSCFIAARNARRVMAIRVQLTVDLNLQNIVENEIDAAMREYQPEKATIILMRPETGEILAMANRPAFDLEPALRSQAGADEKPRHHRHDGARLDLQNRDRGRGFERKEGAARHRRSFARTASGITAAGRCTIIIAYGATERAGHPDQIEQHRRGQARHLRRRTEILRIHSPLRFWRTHRDRIAGRDSGRRFIRRNRGARFPSLAFRWATKSASRRCK